MKSLFSLLLLALLLAFTSCSSAPSTTQVANPGRDTTDTEPNRLLPKKLRGLPVGLYGSHDPNPTTAVYEDSFYVWKHNTSITSMVGDVQLIEYGSYVWTDNDWYLRISMTPQEFADTYACPGAKLKAGVTYTDPASWRRDKTLTGGDALWYFIVEDAKGKRYKGTALIETEARLAGPANDTAAYTFSPARCAVAWTGYGEAGGYSLTGTVPVQAGWCSLNGNLPKAGELVLNMKGIAHPNADLVEHLNNADFFNTPKYPEARFVFANAVSLGGDSCRISGNLTLCGITKPLTLKARVLHYGTLCQVITDFTIDRTAWGIRYNSTSFFSGLGDWAIKNDIRMQFALTGEQQ